MAERTVTLAREQGYRDGYAQACAQMRLELDSLIGLYRETGKINGADALVHARTVLRVLHNRRSRPPEDTHG